jgi:hypothetical protein
MSTPRSSSMHRSRPDHIALVDAARTPQSPSILEGEHESKEKIHVRNEHAGISRNARIYGVEVK